MIVNTGYQTRHRKSKESKGNIIVPQKKKKKK